MATRTTNYIRVLSALVAGAAAVLVALVVSSYNHPAEAQATTITVNTKKDEAIDDGNCSLREAIEAANTDTASGSAAGECAKGSGDDVIDIRVKGTVKLTGVLPDLSTNMQIKRPGADQFTVRRDTGGDYRIFSVTGDTTDVSLGDDHLQR